MKEQENKRRDELRIHAFALAEQELKEHGTEGLIWHFVDQYVNSKIYEERASRPKTQEEKRIVKEVCEFIIKQTEIPVGARNPTRDEKVIIGEWIVDLIERFYLSRHTQEGGRG